MSRAPRSPLSNERHLNFNPSNERSAAERLSSIAREAHERGAPAAAQGAVHPIPPTERPECERSACERTGCERSADVRDLLLDRCRSILRGVECVFAGHASLLTVNGIVPPEVTNTPNPTPIPIPTPPASPQWKAA